MTHLSTRVCKGEKDKHGDRALTPQVCVEVRGYISNQSLNVLALEMSLPVFL